MLLAVRAILLQFHTIRMKTLFLGKIVIPMLAFGTL
jgi:hypothetical protein